MNEWRKCGISIPWNTIHYKKKWNTDKCYSIDETWNYVKWKKHKWLQGLWFYLCEMSRVSTSIAMESRLEMVNTQEREGRRVGIIGVGFFLVLCLVAASCPTLCDPMDCILCPWGFSRWESLNGLLCPPPGDLPSPRIESRSPTLQADSLPTEPQRNAKNTGVGSLSLLQRILPTQELNWDLLHCRQILYQLSFQGSPRFFSV